MTIFIERTAGDLHVSKLNQLQRIIRNTTWNMVSFPTFHNPMTDGKAQPYQAHPADFILDRSCIHYPHDRNLKQSRFISEGHARTQGSRTCTFRSPWQDPFWMVRTSAWNVHLILSRGLFRTPCSISAFVTRLEILIAERLVHRMIPHVRFSEAVWDQGERRDLLRFFFPDAPLVAI